ncbi:tyrosine-type recombinase/integrase [Ruminiclostridium cellobioparum]|uniref:Site-specific recombinase XerD n=1 Tax=Ruminiclostridium cellobioparum subsp. termitidis CT1112 TaxID=1195236 RepID=S0FZT1_RUMCE|nr:tyrosine-type recombinase/integrase [Ruminiclostridium cellobioparum]EMS74058.1 Site-specific recombinase XerD [Ruminiclostridium cellobioparum subsp. termitidis CT1112]
MGKRVTKINQSMKSRSWEDALNEFLLLKKAEGRSRITLDDYERHIYYFFNRFPNSWTNGALKVSVMQYMSDNIKPATYNIRRAYLKAFFEWCLNQGYISENPLEGFKKRKAQERIVDVPEDILERLLKLPDHNTFTGVRDKALIIFTLDTGLRPKEVLSLIIDNFDLKRLIVTIPAEIAKTRTARTLPMLKSTADAIDYLIQVRHPSWKSTAPVFCSNEGTKLGTSSWGDRLELYSKQLGFKVCPYDLRHSFALLYLRSGGNAFGLQASLGHTDMNMSKKYVNLSGNDLQEMHKTASPLNRLIKNKNRVGQIKK